MDEWMEVIDKQFFSALENLNWLLVNHGDNLKVDYHVESLIECFKWKGNQRIEASGFGKN